jgi:hypothetical protein
MTDELDLLIDEDGTVRYVYDDLLADAFEGEQKTTTRASHVEPHPTQPGWLADMRPSGGPVLGFGDCSYETNGDFTSVGIIALLPFRTRQEALQAERIWLRRERGL